MLRIGMLTSGGDCQALNAAMRGVVKGICNKRKDVEIYGFKDGYKGLIYSDFNMLTSRDFSGILTQGGTILGTSRQPFKLMRVPDKDGIDKVEAMKHTYHKLHLDCLVVLGGNGTHKTANLLREEGLNVVTLPKTIDNDLWGTDMTFGFQSAVDIATDTIDRIHTTATSHSRVFIIEVMGHKVGHVTLHAGIAGGADVILLPEIPYDIKAIKNVIDKRTQAGKRFTILAVAEGAISKEDAKLKKKEYKEKLSFYCLCFFECSIDLIKVISINIDYMEIKCLKLLIDRVRRVDFCNCSINLKIVIINDNNEIIQFSMCCQHGSLPYLTFLDLTVSEQCVYSVVCIVKLSCDCHTYSC